MKIKIFPKYTEIGASSRYRVYQYLPYFDKNSIEVYPFFDENYNSMKSYRNFQGVIYVLKCYVRRIINMLRLRKTDIVLVQYEFIPFTPFNVLFFKLLNINYIVDYDDATFHEYDQNRNRLIRFFFKNKIKKVIKNAKYVITGSTYLSSYAKKYNSNVIEIPTSIDFSKYIIKQNSNTKLVIGWIGSKTTSLHLKLIIDALKILTKINVKFELRLIGYSKQDDINFEDISVVEIPWDSSNEIEELNKIDVGIMPLIDFPFARGKCAFKLIQYMALGKPTISTPFEANLNVDKNQENLFASSTDEWVKCFVEIYENKEHYYKTGLRNRDLILKNYSIQSNNVKYKNIFKKMI